MLLDSRVAFNCSICICLIDTSVYFSSFSFIFRVKFRKRLNHEYEDEKFLLWSYKDRKLDWSKYEKIAIKARYFVQIKILLIF